MSVISCSLKIEVVMIGLLIYCVNLGKDLWLQMF